MTSAEIKALIEADETAKAFADAGNDTAAAERASVIAPAVLVLISSSELLAWSGGGASDSPSVKCRRLRIRQAAESHPSNVVQGACIAADGMLDRDGTQLDLSLSDRVAMLGALVAGGVLTQAENDELLAMASRPQTVTANQVSEAWASYRPDGKVA